MVNKLKFLAMFCDGHDDLFSHVNKYRPCLIIIQNNNEHKKHQINKLGD